MEQKARTISQVEGLREGDVRLVFGRRPITPASFLPPLLLGSRKPRDPKSTATREK